MEAAVIVGVVGLNYGRFSQWGGIPRIIRSMCIRCFHRRYILSRRAMRAERGAS